MSELVKHVVAVLQLNQGNKMRDHSEEESRIAWYEMPAEIARLQSEVARLTKENEGMSHWKKLALEAMRYLDADQINAATKAAGAVAIICAPLFASHTTEPK